MKVEGIRLIDGKQIEVALIPYENQKEEAIKDLLGPNLRHATREESNSYIEKLFDECDKHKDGFLDFFGSNVNISLCTTSRFLKEKDNTDSVCFIARTGKEVKDWIAAGFWDEVEEVGIEDYLGVIVVLK